MILPSFSALEERYLFDLSYLVLLNVSSGLFNGSVLILRIISFVFSVHVSL